MIAANSVIFTYMSHAVRQPDQTYSHDKVCITAIILIVWGSVQEQPGLLQESKDTIMETHQF